MTDFARAVPGRVAPAPVAETERWIGRAAAVLPGGALNVLQWPNRRPLVVSRGCGATIVDVDGGEYVDFLLGSGPLIVGHAHPHVVEAVQAQASEGSTFYALNRPAIELAERIVQHVPCAELVRFCSTGSEAVFFALRIARAVTGRNAILKFEGAFHGSSDYALMSVTPKRDLRYPLAEPETAGVSNAVTEGVLVAPYNDAEATAALVREHAESLAAVIVEPVQRAIPPVSGFLQALRRITQEHGILLIFDEVVTGFRLGLGGAQGLYGYPGHCCLRQSSRWRLPTRSRRRKTRGYGNGRAARQVVARLRVWNALREPSCSGGWTSDDRYPRAARNLRPSVFPRSKDEGKARGSIRE